MPKEQLAGLATPNEGESKDGFMSRCMADGGSEESCAADWDAANPPAEPPAEGASAGLSLSELAERKRKLIHDNRQLLERADKAKRQLTSEEAQEYDRRDKDIEKLDSQINGLADHETRRQRQRANEESLNRPLPRQTSNSCGGRCGGRTLSLSFGRGGTLQFSPDNQLASEKYGRAFTKMLRGEPGNYEALGLKVADDTKGGYLAPMTWVAQMIKFLDDEVFIRQLATVLPPTTAKSVGAVSYDTDPGDADWTPEVPASDTSEDDAMRFGGRELVPHGLSKLIKASLKLVRSSSINIDSFVAERMAYKFAVPEEKAFIDGDGVNKPLGVFTSHADGVTTSQDVRSSSTTDFTADDLISCLFDLKDGYVNKATWLASREFRRRCRKLKDGEGRYLLTENANGGLITTLLDRPLRVSEFAPATYTASKYVAVVGDFSNYWIQDALGVEIQTLLELFRLKQQIGWIGSKETDGMPVLAEAFRRLQLKA